MMHRRSLLAAVSALALAGPALAAPASRSLQVFKTEGCTCCEGWVAAMTKVGFRASVSSSDNIVALWRKHGVPDALSSCHMGLVDGYVLVGHVPPADVEKLLRDRPKAIGLSVPGMPFGSPGMEIPSGHRQAFDTVLFGADGKQAVFTHYPAVRGA